jgi:hypothetical protein
MPRVADEPARHGRNLIGFYLATGAVLVLFGLGVPLYRPLMARYWIWKMPAHGRGTNLGFNSWKVWRPDLAVCEPMLRLRAIGRPAIPPLIAALDDPDETRSAMARDTLCLMTDAPATWVRRGPDGRVEWARDKIVCDCRAWWAANKDSLEWDEAKGKYIGTRDYPESPSLPADPPRELPHVIILNDTPYPCRIIRQDEKTVTVELTESKSVVTVERSALDPAEMGLSGPRSATTEGQRGSRK